MPVAPTSIEGPTSSSGSRDRVTALTVSADTSSSDTSISIATAELKRTLRLPWVKDDRTGRRAAQEKPLSKPVRIYVAIICLLGYGGLAYSLQYFHIRDAERAWLFILLSCLGSTWKVSLRALARNSTSASRGASMSVGFAFTYAAILYAGVPVGVLTAALTGLISPWIRRKPEPRYQTLFNGASLAMSAWSSGMLYFWTAQENPYGPPGSPPPDHLLAVLLSTYVYYMVSTWSVATVVALVRAVSPVATWVQTFLWTAPGYFIGSATAVVAVAYYGHYGMWVFAVTIPAILATQRSYKAYLDRVEETQQRYDEVQHLYQESLQLVSQSEKMASIGTLAGGIAHEINNPLMVILGRTELVLSDLPEDHECVRDLKVIEEETRRIAGIVGELLRFSRRDSAREFLPVDLNEVIKRSLHLLQYQMRVDDVVIETDLEPGLPAVAGNGGRLQQVLTNMLLNAYHAMRPRGGRLTIKTWAEVSSVYVRISDTGCGIPAHALPRIFEPFFTTKSESDGTGLGLSVSYGIIKEHNGQIDVESIEGRGATFTIRLPAQEIGSDDRSLVSQGAKSS